MTPDSRRPNTAGRPAGGRLAPRWLQVQRHIAREQQDYRTHKSDESDCVMIARLAVELHCYLPEELDETWAHLRHLGRRRAQLIHSGDGIGPAGPVLLVGGLADGDRDMRSAAAVQDLAGGP